MFRCDECKHEWTGNTEYMACPKCSQNSSVRISGRGVAGIIKLICLVCGLGFTFCIVITASDLVCSTVVGECPLVYLWAVVVRGCIGLVIFSRIVDIVNSQLLLIAFDVVVATIVIVVVAVIIAVVVLVVSVILVVVTVNAGFVGTLVLHQFGQRVLGLLGRRW